MRHNKSGNQLSRTSSQRLAMMRNMVTSLIQHEKITTTDAKAKELRKLADKMVTLGKKNSLHARRQALQIVRERSAVARLFDLLAPRYHNRPGGYTRIIKLGNRLGDNAPLSRIEFVEELDPSNIKVRKKTEKNQAPAEEAAGQEENSSVSPEKEGKEELDGQESPVGETLETEVRSDEEGGAPAEADTGVDSEPVNQADGKKEI